MSLIKRNHSVLAAYIVVVVLLLVAVIVSPQVASWQSLRTILILVSYVGLIGIGQTMVILTGQIDLSVPWTLNLAAILMASSYGLGASPAVALLLALGVGLFVGLLNSIGVGFLRVNALVWTLGVNFLLEGIALVYVNAQLPRSALPDFVLSLANGTFLNIPLPIVLWAILSAVAILFLNRTRTGRYIYSVGNNAVASLLSGINVRRVLSLTYLASGIGAALVGVLLAGYAGQSFLGMGNDYQLIPIAAVVIGGTNILGGSGSYIGTIAGAMVVTLLDSLLTILQVAQAIRYVIFGMTLLVAVLLYGRRKKIPG